MLFNNICVLGDSISRGVIYNTEKNRYTFLKDCFVNLVGKDNSFTVNNLAKFGCTIKKGLSIFESQKDKLVNCDCVILEFGGNDCDFNWQNISDSPDDEHSPNTPISIFTETYHKIISELTALGKKVIILNLPPLDAQKYFNWVSKNKQPENILKFLGGNAEYIYRWHEMYNEAVCNIANSMKVSMIDVRSAFLSHRDYTDYLCDDGIHPNEKGHELIRNALNNAINFA